MIKFIDEPGMIEPNPMGGGADEIIKSMGAKTAIMVFSQHIFEAFDKVFGVREIGRMYSSTNETLYEITAGSTKAVLVKSGIGAPAATAFAEELLVCGLNNLIAYGICGALVKTPTRSFVVPTRAFRDEGTSYHYAPAAEYIEIKNAEKLKAALDNMGLDTLCGGVWTTDGFYRETKTRRDELIGKGCVAVDMESAALQAMCDYRRKNFYTFFITADSLSDDEWQPNYIFDGPKSAPLDELGAKAVGKLVEELGK